MSGVAHVGSHVGVPPSPVVHAVPATHTVPALPASAPHPLVAPQYRGFVVGSMQAPLHSTSPAWQETEHVPPEQT